MARAAPESTSTLAIVPAPVDAAPPVADAMTPVADAMMPVADAMAPVADAMVPVADAMVPVADAMMPIKVLLPSALPSGYKRNDQIVLSFYPPDKSKVPATGAPVVVMLPYLGATNAPEFHRFARFLAARGIAAAVMTLPFHGERAIGIPPVNFFVSNDVDVVVKTWNQAASDVSTVVTWLEAQPDIDRTRIAGAGTSLGAILLHLSMGRDPRISAGVAFLGGGDLPLIFRNSLLTKLRGRGRPRRLSPEEEAKLRTVDPLSYAQFNQPRRVLMVQGARDIVVPPRAAQELWQALGRPPIRWIPVNHLALQFAEPQVRRASYEFLQSVWRGETNLRAPRIYAPTLKAGFISGLDSRLTPALTLEPFTLGHGRHHLPLIEFNVGLSGRGPFAGIATPITQFADIGLARRLNGSKLRPYLSYHLAF